MREGKAEQVTRNYYYKRCSSCRNKLHADAHKCGKCGAESEFMIYCSHDPNDAKFNMKLCDVDKCFNCWNIQNGKEPCKPIFCFGTGRGKCDICKQVEGLRFDCCQEWIKQEGAFSGNLSEVIREMIKNGDINPGPLANSIQKSFEYEYEDEIPF